MVATISVSDPTTTAALETASLDFTFTPSIATTTVMTLGAGWSPSSLSWTASNTPQNATYTPPATGTSAIIPAPSCTNLVTCNTFPDISPLQFRRILTTPVLAKGATYNGWQADAQSAPGFIWDGKQFVLVTTVWSTANNQWASVFFTSPNLRNWAYVNNSLRNPGADFIYGNGTILKPTTGTYAGLYMHIYNRHYSDASMDTSPDLETWTLRTSQVTGAYFQDPGAVINPVTGNIELLGMDNNNPRRILMFHSSDGGASYTSDGVLLLPPSWCAADFGEPQFFYGPGPDGSANCRYLTFDVSPNTTGHRSCAIYYATYAGSNTWNSLTPLGICHVADTNNSWENSQVFDMFVGAGLIDLGDGRGPMFWGMHSGGDNFSPTNATDSSMGLVHLNIRAWNDALLFGMDA